MLVPRLDTLTYFGPLASKTSRICLSMLFCVNGSDGQTMVLRIAELSCNILSDVVCEEAA